MVEVYKPEQRSIFSKLFGGIQQGMGAFNQGSQAYSGYQSMFGGGGTTGGTYGGGGSGGMGSLGGAAATGAGGKYGLGINLGAKAGGTTAAAAEGTTAAGTTAAATPAVEASSATAAGSAGEGIASYAPYAAPVVAGIATKKDYEETGGQNVGPIGTSPRAAKSRLGAAESTMQAGRDIDAEKNRFGRRLGLGLTDTEQSDQMGAIERRMSSQQDAERSITEARDALKIANLPPDEARSIERKLEMARKKLNGGNRRGSNTSYS